MNKKTIKCIATSLAVLSCMYTVPQRVFAETISSNDLEVSNYYTLHKDKCKDKEKDKEKDNCKYKDEKKAKDDSKCKDEKKVKDDYKCKDEKKVKDDCKYKDEKKAKDDSKCKDEMKKDYKEEKDYSKKCKEEKDDKMDDSKGKQDEKLDMFTNDNCKYLSSDQLKALKEYKAIVEKGDKLTEEQRENLRNMIDSILKGKLGDEKYKNFMSIMEKKSKGTKLTSDEEKQLKEYKDMIEK